MSEKVYFIGVDVGSGSVRAALVDQKGRVVKASVKEIKTWKPLLDYYEQSSNDIWECCIHVIKEVIADVSPSSVKGIGFDATCSLVALDKYGNPMSVSTTNSNEQNIIMWMDHRAQAEADFINKTGHDILKYVGGKVSLEMEIPKLLWLKRNSPDRWPHYGYFFDLPDFLTWKATGSLTRSLCSLVCKWNYVCSIEGFQGWNEAFLKEIGLEDFIENNFEKIGNKVLMPGDFCGGLSDEVASILGLQTNTPVATSIIDAHAGGLGMIGASAKGIDKEMSSRLSLICGTSTCHMAVNEKAILVEGIWGPYFSAMVPKMWLNEAGQSASGMLLDHIIASHPAGVELLKTRNTGDVRNYLRELLSNMAKEQSLPDVSFLTKDVHVWPDFHGNRSPLADAAMRGMISGLSIDKSVRNYLRELLSNMAKEQSLPDVSFLTKDVHVWPDFHGNRSPLADAAMRGMISGLSIDKSERNLAVLYLATLQALSYGTRHIIDALILAGYKPFKSLLVCGGITKDQLFVQIQADAVDLPVLKPHEKYSVLVGSAILGACASQYFNNVEEAIQNMGGTADVIQPNKRSKLYHDKKYTVFLRMFQDQLKYKTIMKTNA